MAIVLGFHDPEARTLLSQHRLDDGIVHDNLAASDCSCSQSDHPTPNTSVGADGGVCFACGGMTQRTGSCTTCTSCGTSSGCG